MKQCGRTVCVIRCNENNLRNGESSFLRRKDGSILHVYTRYGGESGWDDGNACMAYCVSRDEGETWGEFGILFPKDEGAKNNMSASLLRLPDGAMGLVYLRKHEDGEGRLFCMPVFRRSEDEGETWSDMVFCAEGLGYYISVNDSALVLSDGRIMIPMAYAGDGRGYCAGKLIFSVSEDCGKTWKLLPCRLNSPFEDEFGLQEPGVLEHEDGTLWLWCRTVYGHQYQAFSEDGGATWSRVVPNFHFTSPDSPMRVKHVGPMTAAVFNPCSYECTREETEQWKSPKRSPLVCTWAEGDGKELWAKGKTVAHGDLEPLRRHTFIAEPLGKDSACYPAVIGVKDGFLISYYHSGGTPMCLKDTKIVKVRFDELQG